MGVLNNRDGMALTIVVTVLAVLFILVASMSMLVGNVIRRASYQEEELREHYLVSSAVELCYYALIDVGTGDETNSVAYQNYSEEYYAEVTNTPTLYDSVSINGTMVDFVIRGIELNGQRWVDIEASIENEGNIVDSAKLQFLLGDVGVVLLG